MASKPSIPYSLIWKLVSCSLLFKMKVTQKYSEYIFVISIYTFHSARINVTRKPQPFYPPSNPEIMSEMFHFQSKYFMSQ